MRSQTHLRFYPLLEHPAEGTIDDLFAGRALARVVEAHSDLAGLLDFCSVDPVQIALEVGMVSPSEEDGLDDLREIDLGEPEWFEASAGLTAVRQALSALRHAPQSVAAAIYDPGLHPDDVITDLEFLERALLQAQQQEVRFRFTMET